MIDAATEAQNAASEPGDSTWLSANAGSGKTRVLTSRVARLLLNGVEPQDILCLTFTKAAAGEMQNRLFKTLGAWAMLDDAALRKALEDLGEVPPADLSLARTLFAGAIEAPGGLKIQTIHALCASILRQFPVEAGVNPQFREIDERGQSVLIDDVLDAMAAGGERCLAAVAEIYSDGLADLGKNVSGNADSFATMRGRDEIYAAFGVPKDQSSDKILGLVFRGGEIEFLKSLGPILRAFGSVNDHRLADKFDSLLDGPSFSNLSILENCLLNKSGGFVAKIGSVPTKKVQETSEFLPLLPELNDIIVRVEQAHHARVAFESANQAVAVEEFAQAFLPAYAHAKEGLGLLDFDDLIRHTRALLTDQSLQWVMYRLDGRIDHILVDEAQDTSPAQWDVIEALAHEMSSGESDRSRTLFVVGDKKQSIYSFQGADAAGFDRRAARFESRMKDGQGLKKRQLEHSFRSSPAILQVVDHVFADQDISGLGDEVGHQSYHDEMPGRVDLWPLITPTEKPIEPPWYAPVDRPVENEGSVLLGEMIAEKIKELIETGSIPGKDGPQAIRPGDIMVLVQRRSALFDQIIQSCKARSLDIAGSDRLKITSELAVRDLLALLSFLALPEDSLSLAAALRSPLFGWSEQELYTLAAKRPKDTHLWQALRAGQDAYAQTLAVLNDLRKAVDFDRPHELLDRILSRHKGRERLLARLGPEAEDGINELLNQALAYEMDATPSLTGFLAVARSTDISVKRQPDTSGNLIRVMTVHGAKGLESPVVILPDTTFGTPRQRNELLEDSQGIPVLPRSKENDTPNIKDAKEAKKRADAEERNRLLYVAMTRAEKWLIVCGVKPQQNAASKASWHEMVKAGLGRAGAEALETDLGKGLRYAWRTWPERPKSTQSETKPGEFAKFEFGPVSAPKAGKSFLSPSQLGGAKVIGGGDLEEEAALKRGRQIHLLLEHLPGAEAPELLGDRLLSFGPDAATSDERADLLEEALGAIRSHPEVFGTNALAEVDISADLPTLGAPVAGTIDRLIVLEDSVLAIDFKSNARVPDTPDQTPESVLRQMGAYLEALEMIYPNRTVSVAVLWTKTATLMPLGHGIVRAALARATTS